MTIRVNGDPVDARANASGYVTIQREWREGDIVEIGLPMSLRTEALPGNAGIVAILDGPIVLAGKLGTEGMPEGGTFAEDQWKFAKWPAPAIPVLVGEAGSILASLQPVPGEALTFRTRGIGRPRDVTLEPFYRLHHERYAIYWTLQSAASSVAGP
jgi:DUF1680 family protein